MALPKIRTYQVELRAVHQALMFLLVAITMCWSAQTILWHSAIPTIKVAQGQVHLSALYRSPQVGPPTTGIADSNSSASVLQLCSGHNAKTLHMCR